MSRHVSAIYSMRLEPEAPVECRIQNGSSGPFPYLVLGHSFTVLPNLAQLAAIRDAITACLESPEAQNLLDAEAEKAPVQPRSIKRSPEHTDWCLSVQPIHEEGDCNCGYSKRNSRPTPDVKNNAVDNNRNYSEPHSLGCAIWLNAPCNCGVARAGSGK